MIYYSRCLKSGESAMYTINNRIPYNFFHSLCIQNSIKIFMSEKRNTHYIHCNIFFNS